jgi:phosphoribosyl-dephospho-CoA transferase
MKKGRDVKFVIYQVLYIFVVCVISIKGADLTLEEVLDAKQVVKKTYADSLKKYIDSILALGLIPSINIDTNKKYTPEDMEKIMAELNQLKKDMPPPIVQQEQMKINVERTVPKIETKEPEKIKKATVQGVELTQYSQSKIKNPYSETLVLTADGRTLASIAPQQTATVLLGGESTVTFRVGDATDTKPTKQKQAPKIDIQKVGPGGSDASLRSVQNSVGCRVTIISSNLGDLSVNISGPVKQQQVSASVFDVTLTLLGSEAAFDAWSKGKEAPYRVTFTVSVKDKYNPKFSISQIGVFTFGKW